MTLTAFANTWLGSGSSFHESGELRCRWPAVLLIGSERHGLPEHLMQLISTESINQMGTAALLVEYVTLHPSYKVLAIVSSHARLLLPPTAFELIGKVGTLSAFS